MTKLTDTQSILLSTAAQRDGGSLFPLSNKLKPAGASKSIASLIAAKFVEERESRVTEETYRSDADLQFGAYITPAGLAAIGIDDGDGGEVRPPAPAPAPAAPPARTSKSAAVVALLQRDGGATLAELVEATGWLPHTTRAALTGLRKKGHTIERGKRDDATCYSIKAAS